jgi:outer membrane immunogenic protein
LAVTKLKGTFAFSDTTLDGSVFESGAFSKTKTGWTLGGGVEVGLTPSWTARAEYLYVDFGNETITSNNLFLAFIPAPRPLQTFTHSADLRSNIVRVAVNYRFR